EALAPRQRLRGLSGEPDWLAIRDLFPLAPDWTHLSSFLFVSHPKPVADAIDHFRRKLDSDAMWIEIAAFTDAEGQPFAAVKRALADYTGGSPTEIAFTSNTTSALAMAYHGLRIRADQEILTTEHDHYSHHESIRYSAARSGARVRVPVGPRGCLARAATDDSQLRSGRHRHDVRDVRGSRGIATHAGSVRLAGRVSCLRAPTRRSGGSGPAPHHWTRPHRRAHCRIERGVPGRRGQDSRPDAAHAARSGALRRDLVFRSAWDDAGADRGATC